VAHFLDHPFERLPHAVSLAVAIARQLDAGAQHAAGVEAEVHTLQRQRGANQQAGADQQHQRQRDFRHDQQLSSAIVRDPHATAAATAQHPMRVGARGSPRWHQAEQQAAAHGDGDGDADRQRIEPGLFEARHALGREPDKGVDGDEGEEQAAGGPERRQHQALGQQLPHDPAAARAHCRSHRQFLRAHRTARQQQVGDIAAGDQQHQADGTEQDEQLLAIVADEVAGEVEHRGAALGQIVGMRLPQLLGKLHQLRARLFHGHAWLQPRDQRQIVAAELVPARFLDGPGHPQLFGVAGEPERRRHHAQHPERAAIQSDVAADDRRIGAEPADPQLLAQHHDLLAPQAIVAGAEHGAEHRRNAVNIEEIAAHDAADQAFRILTFADVEAAAVLDGNAGERRGALVPGVETARRGRPWTAAPQLGQEDEPLRFRHWQWPQHHRMDNAEDRRRRPDAERERQHRDDGESKVLAQLTNGKREILPQLGQVLMSAHGAIPLISQLREQRPRPIDVAKPRHRRPPRLLGRHTGGQILTDAHLEVKGKLPLDLVLDLRLPQPRAQQLPTHN
jgi:hypothetical protein